MQKTIIKQQGDPQELNAEKLQTRQTALQSTVWVPDADTTGMGKGISANGTYDPANDHYYGFTWVGVSVTASSVTGKGEDGKTYTVTKDASGNLVWTEVEGEE